MPTSRGGTAAVSRPHQRAVDEYARTIRTLDLASRREVQVDPRMAKWPVAVAGDGHLVGLDRLERHRVGFSTSLLRHAHWTGHCCAPPADDAFMTDSLTAPRGD
jgi:hypothetical protein